MAAIVKRPYLVLATLPLRSCLAPPRQPGAVESMIGRNLPARARRTPSGRSLHRKDVSGRKVIAPSLMASPEAVVAFVKRVE